MKTILDYYKSKSVTERGFTLIEMLVTLTLISIGIVGLMIFFNTIYYASYHYKNESIASNLAQESNEIIRNIVSSNVMSARDWYANITNQDVTLKYCLFVDSRDLTDGICNTDGNRLCRQAVSGVDRYVQCSDTGSPPGLTPLKRVIAVYPYEANGVPGIDLNLGDCIRVVTTVSWSSDQRRVGAVDVICKPSYQ